MKKKRIFIGWFNGAFITSACDDFPNMLEDLIKQYGAPDTVEYRDEFE